MSLRALVVATLLLSCAGCGGEDAPAQEPAKWRIVFEDLPGALISVSGTATDDVWTVGGNPVDGSGAFALHFDGATWKRIATGQDADLWWVHAFAGGPVFFGGTQGTILRYENGTFEKLSTPSNGTVFGIWGVAPNDLWAVGGDPQKPGARFVWRYDGSSWAAPADFPDLPINSWFKVWGRSAEDVRFVGMDGQIVHYDGSSYSVADSGTTRRLLTLYAEPAGRWTAVGGVSEAVILEDDGGGWQSQSPSEPTAALIGVRTTGDDGYAVGNNGSVLRRGPGGWKPEGLGFDVFKDFHSVWIDPDRGVWVAGGDILAVPLVNGVLLHKGAKVPGGTYE